MSKILQKMPIFTKVSFSQNQTKRTLISKAKLQSHYKQQIRVARRGKKFFFHMIGGGST